MNIQDAGSLVVGLGEGGGGVRRGRALNEMKGFPCSRGGDKSQWISER